MHKPLLAAALVSALAACSVGERLSEVGQAPDLTPISDPRGEAAAHAVALPMPDPEPAQAAGANSLWRSGARSFFRDQRARRVGDVLTVQLTIDDRAALSNETSRSRESEDDLGVGGFFGLESKLDNFLPGDSKNPVDPDTLVQAQSGMSNRGRGAVRRSEDINVNVAALITQLLPNGNLVIQGRQEVRVNFEVREVIVAGIARPEDITPRNTIPHDKIAELRVAYGGRGQITDVQQPRYGSQVMDILLPY